MKTKKLPIWLQVLSGLVLAFVIITIVSDVFVSNDTTSQQDSIQKTPALVTFNSPADVLSFFRYKNAEGIDVISESPFEVKIWEGDFWNEVGDPKNDLFLKRILVDNLYLLFFHTNLDQVTMTIYAQDKEGKRLSNPGYTVSMTRGKALDVAKDIFQVGSVDELFEVDEFYAEQPAMNLMSRKYHEVIDSPEKLNQLIVALGASKI